MSEFPSSIKGSQLWYRINDKGLQQALVNFRKIAEAIGAQTSRILPTFTDHSVIHMDALWKVADQVYTQEEIAKFSHGEAFILGCSFYLHDLGMAIAAMPEGLAQVKQSPTYTSVYERACLLKNLDPQKADALAIEIACRDLHSDFAEKLINEKIAFIDQYLLEDSELRRMYAWYIGQISASHRWSFSEIDRRLGARGREPDPLGGEIDLGLLAWSIRVIDAAHINSDRAAFWEKALRSQIAPDSLIHWKAQEHINGPCRQEDRLVFSSVKPISDIDAWWQFYNLAISLDNEINLAREYLSARASSKGRFSLEGVKSVRSPKNFATLVKPYNFEPLDVRVYPQSIERLVNLLGGKSLYGHDYFAPIRELLQNARDAILLKQTSDQAFNLPKSLHEIHVGLKFDLEGGYLSVEDNGVGMSPIVISNYLLGIAADYWNSHEFFSDFPGVSAHGFKPAGKFGIGFLSVFMIGNEVTVITERLGGQRFKLSLRGLERRGALTSYPSNGRCGTLVQIRIPKTKLSDYDGLDAIVRSKAPLLEIPVVVSQGDKPSTIVPGWWKTIPQAELFDFVINYEQIAFRPTQEQRDRLAAFKVRKSRPESFADLPSSDRWPGLQPEITTDSSRVMAIPGSGQVILCSNGFAINRINLKGFTGLIDVGNIELTAARSQTIKMDVDNLRNDLSRKLFPEIVKALNELINEGQIPTRFDFLNDIGNIYSEDLLCKTSLPWVTIMEPPGNAVLLSASDFKNLLAKTQELIIGFAVNPWEMGSMLYSRFPEASRNVLLIPVKNNHRYSFGTYRDSDDLVVGPLQDHFEVSDLPQSMYSLLSEALLRITLRLISEAWNIDPEKLQMAKWVRKSTDNICAYFVKGRI
jgi:hypothetical protein